jgi:hypothetical protein
MPVVIEKDAPPLDDNDDSIVDDDGKVPCPECGNRFKSSGLNRHITVTHGAGQKQRTASGTGTSKRSVSIANAGMQFQQGVALFVSMACQQCATCLYQDAEKDWVAIDEFCNSRPKLRKQVQDMLTMSDAIMLAGALMGTAQKMVSHHSIGAKLPFGIAGNSNSEHDDGHNPASDMAKFMMGIPEDERNRLVNEALASMASTNGSD